MPVLQALVERFDEAAQSGDPTEHKLKYVSAADVLPILRAALVEPGKTGEIDSSNISNLSGSNSSFSGSSYNSSSSNSSDMSGSKDVSARVAVKDDTDKATSVIVGKTRLIADNRTNTIVVIGPPASSKMVDQVLAVVDRPPKQVYLSTVIGQMSNTGSQELGIDILQKFTGNPNLGVGTISNPFKVTGPLNPQGVQVGTSAITQAAAGTNVYGLAGNTIAFYVQALQQTNRFRILSRPSVYTSNNKKAIISSGSEQPVPSSTQSNLVGNGNATNTSTVLNTNVQYKNVVLELAVVPLINANNEVTLNIAQRNDSLGDNVAVGSTTARAINTQELTTSITVANGQTVVLGGLLSDRDDLEKTGTPILSDIPILGALFSNTKKSTTKNELIILIQPIVIESPELAELQKDKQVQSEGLDQEAVKFLNQGNSMMKTPAEETHQFLRDVFNLPPPVPHR
jgi:type II secretory pathway component GspD/PulD (secretin)